MGKEAVTVMSSQGGTLTDDRIEPTRNRTWRSSPSIYLSDANTIPALTIHQTCSWSVSVSSRLDELARLTTGWDDYGALPPDKSYLLRARDFLSSELIASIVTKPDLVPTYDGGLLIEWHTEVIDLIIELGPTGDTLYVCDNETSIEVEAALSESIEQLTSALIKLRRWK